MEQINIDVHIEGKDTYVMELEAGVDLNDVIKNFEQYEFSLQNEKLIICLGYKKKEIYCMPITKLPTKEKVTELYGYIIPMEQYNKKFIRVNVNGAYNILPATNFMVDRECKMAEVYHLYPLYTDIQCQFSLRQCPNNKSEDRYDAPILSHNRKIYKILQYDNEAFLEALPDEQCEVKVIINQTDFKTLTVPVYTINKHSANYLFEMARKYMVGMPSHIHPEKEFEINGTRSSRVYVKAGSLLELIVKLVDDPVLLVLQDDEGRYVCQKMVSGKKIGGLYLYEIYEMLIGRKVRYEEKHRIRYSMGGRWVEGSETDWTGLSKIAVKLEKEYERKEYERKKSEEEKEEKRRQLEDMQELEHKRRKDYYKEHERKVYEERQQKEKMEKKRQYEEKQREERYKEKAEKDIKQNYQKEPSMDMTEFIIKASPPKSSYSSDVSPYLKIIRLLKKNLRALLESETPDNEKTVNAKLLGIFYFFRLG